MENKTKISVASFSTAEIMQHLQRNYGSLSYDNPAIQYEGDLHPLNLERDKKALRQGLKDRGILAVGVIDKGGEIEIISPYFGRRSNRYSDGLSDDEAYTFGYKIGEKFDMGSEDFSLVENYSLLNGLKGISRPSQFFADLTNSLREATSRFSLSTLGIREGAMPFKITNLGQINQGIRDGQFRLDSKKRCRTWAA